MAVLRLDLTGLKCPLPVLRVRKAMRKMAADETLEVLATDPMAAIDIPHFCTSEGHELVQSRQEGGVLQFVIKAGRLA
jgi:tRNA 2-thiouridine synthesizing protein A